MKKFFALTCMIACVFGMTACGESETYVGYQKQKVDDAIVMAEETVIPTIQSVLNDSEADILDEYTSEEVETYIAEKYGMEVEGNAFMSALGSFEAAYEEMLGYGEITGSTAVVDDKQIVVTVYVDGTKQDATAEIVLSNDKFLILQSASLNKVSTFNDAMAKAGMNTLLGMGSVFAVLILISLIISCFSIIPKMQARAEKRKADKAAKKAAKSGTSEAAIENAVAQIAKQEEVAAEAEADDTELIAVIAAAIAASEGATSTDGFVVRSIKRRRA